jgi:hypothetical protein
MLDLSLVTDTLRKILSDALAVNPLWSGGPPPFNVAVSGQHPEQPGNADCELNLYLFHVGADKFLANSFWTSQAQSGAGGQQPVAFEPLCLDLWYLLSAQSKTSYVHEQQVLGVAMRAFHEHGTVKIAAPTPPPDPVTPSEASLVLESPTFDELSRLWQALGQPLRTTAQYRVSVVFLTGQEPPAPQPHPASWTVAAVAAGLPADPALPHLLGTRRTVTYMAPSGPGVAAAQPYEQSPATTAPAPVSVAGQEVTVDARGLADTDQVLLVSFDAGGAPVETDVTTWKVPLIHPYPAPPGSGVPLVIRPPDTPAGPPPGRYQIKVARPTAPGWRSEGVPIGIAAWVDPAGGPRVAAGMGGIYTLTVRNVPASGTELRLGTVPLTSVASGTVPQSGQWQVSGTTLTFAAPAVLPAGLYPVRLRAADIEADPAKWAEVP